MIIICNKCKTRYTLEESRVRKPVFKVRCSRCDHVFTAHNEPPSNLSPYVLNKANEEKPAVHECKIICVCNQKGGVAKTSTVLNLGGSLHMMGKRVLLVDFDVQANLSMLMGFKNAKSFFEVIDSDDDELSRAIVKTKSGVWLLPSNSRMSLAAKKYINVENFEYLLREKLEKIKQVFDYIFIDTPPSGDFFTLNSLLASDFAVIPTQCEYLSMNGVGHIVNMIEVIKKKSSHKIDYRCLVTLYGARNTVQNVIMEKIKNKYNGNMFDTVIHRDSSVQESQIVHMSALAYNEKSRAGKQYMKLAKELEHVRTSN